MSNIVSDIVQEYNTDIKRGVKEVYYKQDLVAGVKLVFAIIGIAKIAMFLGGIAVSAIGALISFAARNPQVAYKIGQQISNNSQQLTEMFQNSGKMINEKYQRLGEKEKKQVRTVILFVAKGGLTWEDLK